jgi:hypothetical protein
MLHHDGSQSRIIRQTRIYGEPNQRDLGRNDFLQRSRKGRRRIVGRWRAPPCPSIAASYRREVRAIGAICKSAGGGSWQHREYAIDLRRYSGRCRRRKPFHHYDITSDQVMRDGRVWIARRNRHYSRGAGSGLDLVTRRHPRPSYSGLERHGWSRTQHLVDLD